MRAHRALHFELAALGLGLCALDDVERQLRRHGGAAHTDAGALEERAPIHRLREHAGQSPRQT